MESPLMTAGLRSAKHHAVHAVGHLLGVSDVRRSGRWSTMNDSFMTSVEDHSSCYSEIAVMSSDSVSCHSV